MPTLPDLPALCGSPAIHALGFSTIFTPPHLPRWDSATALVNCAASPAASYTTGWMPFLQPLFGFPGYCERHIRPPFTHPRRGHSLLMGDCILGMFLGNGRGRPFVDLGGWGCEQRAAAKGFGPCLVGCLDRLQAALIGCSTGTAHALPSRTCTASNPPTCSPRAGETAPGLFDQRCGCWPLGPWVALSCCLELVIGQVEVPPSVRAPAGYLQGGQDKSMFTLGFWRPSLDPTCLSSSPHHTVWGANKMNHGLWADRRGWALPDEWQQQNALAFWWGLSEGKQSVLICRMVKKKCFMKRASLLTPVA